LSIAENSISTLDISANDVLENLYANDNTIALVYLSSHDQLKIVDLSNNSLVDFTIKNETNTSITSIDLTGNTNLTCALVDDDSYSANSILWEEEGTTTYSDTYCEYTTILDPNFETALRALNYDDSATNDGQVPTSLIENVTSLNVSNSGISNFTGI
jgi:hypothetical protein